MEHALVSYKFNITVLVWIFLLLKELQKSSLDFKNTKFFFSYMQCQTE